MTYYFEDVDELPAWAYQIPQDGPGLFEVWAWNWN